MDKLVPTSLKVFQGKSKVKHACKRDITRLNEIEKVILPISKKICKLSEIFLWLLITLCKTVIRYMTFAQQLQVAVVGLLYKPQRF